MLIQNKIFGESEKKLADNMTNMPITIMTM